MPSAADLVLWLVITAVDLLVVCFTILLGCFRKFPLLNLYLLASVVTNLTRLVVLCRSGMASGNYIKAYYFSDGLLTLMMFLSIAELAVRLLTSHMRTWKIILLCASVLLFVAGRSYSDMPSPVLHHVVQFSQNLYCTCILGIAALLCFWGLKNRSGDGTAIRLVIVFGVYFCLVFINFESRQYLWRAPDPDILQDMASAWLPLGFGFALFFHQRAPLNSV